MEQQELTQMDKALALVAIGNARAQEFIDNFYKPSTQMDTAEARLFAFFKANGSNFGSYKKDVVGLLEAWTGKSFPSMDHDDLSFSDPHFQYSLLRDNGHSPSHTYLTIDGRTSYVKEDGHRFNIGEQAQAGSYYSVTEAMVALTPDEARQVLSRQGRDAVEHLAARYDDLLFFSGRAPALAQSLSEAANAPAEQASAEQASAEQAPAEQAPAETPTPEPAPQPEDAGGSDDHPDSN